MADDQLRKVFLLRDRFIKQYYGRTFYRYQTIPSNQIIKAALSGSGEEFYIEISRQSGKTEMIVLTLVFLLLFIKDLYEVLGKTLSTPGFYIVIGAPQKEQAKTDFDRLKDYLREPCKDFSIGFDESNGTTLRLTNGNIVYCFPVTPGSHIESKTAHLILIEEAQDVPDTEANKKLLPMGTATNAPVIRIGTAGYQLCDFYRGLNRGGDNVHVYDCHKVIKERARAYGEDGDENHLNYADFVQRQILSKGEYNPEVRSQYFLEWQLEKGMWMTEDAFNKLCDPDLAPVQSDHDNPIIVGMDVAKESDVTFLWALRKEGFKEVVTRVPTVEKRVDKEPPAPLGTYDPGLGEPPRREHTVTTETLKEVRKTKPVYRVLNWFMVTGVLYQQQWEAINEWLERWNVTKMNIDSTGVGDATADYYLGKYNGWDYDQLQRYERAGLRGTVRPVKFTPQSKHVMYTNWEAVIKEGRFLLPAKLDAFTEQERACWQRFRLESINALREWRGSLLNVRHPDKAKGESGDIETDDTLDSCALCFYDPELEPAGFEVSIS